jgi:NADH-quinone oxidoreductase subunit A
VGISEVDSLFSIFQEGSTALTDQIMNAFTLWPLLVFLIAAIALVTAMIGLSAVLGQRHKERTTGDPYESGIIPTGSARIRFDIKFYLMAVFFVIFDLEAVFIFAWACSARRLGWAAYVEILVFVGFLFLALFYLWRVGALDWGTAKHRREGRSGSLR